MGWYIKDLSFTEKRQRRAILDNAGSLSLCVPIVTLFIVASIRLYRRSQIANRLPPPTISALRWKFFYAPVLYRFPRMGTLAQWVAAVMYGAWQLSLALRGSNEDYLHLTKALGTLAASNLPLHFLLAAKSRARLHRWLFLDIPHDKLNTLHRWLGRFIFTLVTLHAVLYLQYFWNTNKMTTKFLEWDVLCGVVGYTLLESIYITSLSLVRHTPSWYFPVFYVTHIVVALLLFPISWFHVKRIRLYLTFAGAIWIWDYTTRRFSLRWGLARVRSFSGGDILQVDISVDGPQALDFTAGSHIFLSVPSLHKLSGGLRANPFTVAAISEDKQTMRLVIRAGMGFTKALQELTFLDAHSNTGAQPTELEDQKIPVSFFLPSQSTLPDLVKYNRVLFIGGGVGGTFCVPLVEHLLHAQQLTRPSTSDSKSRQETESNTSIRFVWAFKNAQVAKWALSTKESLSSPQAVKKLRSCVEVYITAETEEYRSPRRWKAFTPGISEARQHHRRPDLPSIINEELDACCDRGSLAVLVCGPAGMTRAVKDAVGKSILEGKDVRVFFWEEEFGY